MRLKKGDQSMSVSTINYQDESKLDQSNMDVSFSEINKESPCHSLSKNKTEKILESNENEEENPPILNRPNSAV